MKSWKSQDGPVTEVDLEDIVREIGAGVNTQVRLCVTTGLLPRQVDRALQLLVKAGRIKYEVHGRRWSVVGGGGK